jgi:hypothetical protein
MNRFRFASERRGGNYAHNGENEQNGHEADGNEESVNKKSTEHNNTEHEDGGTRCIASQHAREAEVVRRGEYRVDVSRRRFVQEGCRDDCAKSGFEEGVAEGAELRDADADVLCEPCRKEPAAEPAEGAGPGQGAAARTD